MKKDFINTFKRIMISVLAAATVVTSIPVANYSYAAQVDSVNLMTDESVDDAVGKIDIDEASDVVLIDGDAEYDETSITESENPSFVNEVELVDEAIEVNENDGTDLIEDEDVISEEKLAAIIREYDEIVDGIDYSRFLYEEGGEELFEESEEYIRLQELCGIEDESEDRLSRLDAIIVNGFEAGNENIAIPQLTYTTSEVYSAVTRVKNAHPEFFNVTNYDADYEYVNGTFYAKNLRATYNDAYDMTAFNRAINKAMNLVDDGMTDLEKALVLHDFIVNNTCYNKEVASGQPAPTRDVYSAYGVFVNQDAVCNGYALAYQLLLTKAGVESAFITSSQLNHAWNYVKIDGEYYHVDTTWDDPVPNKEGRSRHAYFLFSDSAMNANGRRHYCSDMIITVGGKDTSGISATNTKYDNMYWDSIDAPFVYKDKKWYYLDSDANAIYEGDVLGNEKTLLFNAFGRWRVWGGSGYWVGAYSGFFSDGERLYFNKYDGIYSINFDGSALTKRYDVDINENYAYSCALRFDFKSGTQKAFVTLSQDANQAGTVVELNAEDVGISSNTVTVTYVNSKGLILKEETVVKGGSVKPPANPGDMTGYVFDRWDKNSDNVMQDLLIKPVYKPISYSITYHLDGGINPDNTAITYDIETNVILPEPTHESYAFGGWYQDETLSGSKITEIKKGETGNKDYYAKWLGLTPDNPTISFWGSYATITKNGISTYYLDKGCTVKINITDSTSNTEIYYTIDGSVPTKSNGKKYTAPFEITDTTTMVKAVVYRGDRASGIQTEYVARLIKDITLADTAILLGINESKKINVSSYPTRSYVYPVNWSVDDSTIATVDSDGNVTGHKFGTTTVWASTPNIYSQTVKAGCVVTVAHDKCEVSFVAYDGSVVKTESVDYGESATKPEGIPKTDNGYRFLGWEPYDNITGNTIIHAIYEPIEYAISYVYNGGSSIIDAPETYTVESEDIVLPTSSVKEGYTFAGWHTSSDLSYETGISVIEKGSTGNLVLYASWEERKGTTPVISFNPNDSTYISGHYTIDVGTLVEIEFGEDASSESIYYTLDNTTPDKDSLKYVEPILLDEGEYTIKAVAYYKDKNGEVTTKKVRVASNELKLSDEKSKLKVGESKQLSATAVPSTRAASDIRWSVSDSRIASVSSTGVIKGLSMGSTTVYAKCTDWKGREVVATCIVTVGLDTRNVIFIGWNGVELKNCEVLVNTSATAPEEVWAPEGYRFDGWDKSFYNVTEDLIVYALFAQKEPDIPSITISNNDYALYDGKYLVDAGTQIIIAQSESDTDELEIEYTTDGTNPIDSSSKSIYVAPFGVDEDATISAVVNRNGVYSDVVTADIVVANNSFELDTDYLSLYPNESASLEVINIPTLRNKADIIWKSSNTSVATVSADGLVKGLKYGSATIIAFVKDWKDRNVQFRVEVDVENDSEIESSNVLKISEDYFDIGDSGVTLIDNTCAIYLDVFNPEGDYCIYYTTDGTTPTKSSILYEEPIYLEKDATLKARAYFDGNAGDIITKKYRVCNCEFEIDKNELKVESGSESTISVIKLPDMAKTQNIKWTSSDENVAVVNNGVITANNVGVAVITATVNDWRGTEITVNCNVNVVSAIYHVKFYGFKDEFLKEFIVGEGESIEDSLVPEVPVDIDGYRFVSWDGSYNNIYSDVIINAIYELVEYEIVYEANGGVLPEDVCVTYTCENDDIILPELEPIPECIFAGWYDNEAFEGNPTRYIAKGSYGNKAYFAKWITEKKLHLIWDGKEDGEFVDDVIYTGKSIKPGFEVYYGDKALEAGKDYTFSYKNNVNVNSKGMEKYRNLLVIKGKGNYSGTVTEEFFIQPKSLEEGLDEKKLEVQEVFVKYNKKLQKVKPKVTFNGKTLSSKDIDYSFEDESEGAYKVPGSYEVKITGKGNFTGEIYTTINIIGNGPEEPIIINKYKARVKPFFYGDEIEFNEDNITVYYGKKQLTFGDDYTIVYGEEYNGVPCDKIGSYTAIVRGCGDYCGEFKTKFSIKGISLSTVTIEPIEQVTYNGGPQEVELTVLDKYGEPIDSEYYEASYSKNTNIGTAKVTITGKGLYYGTKSKTFKIVSQYLDPDYFAVSIAGFEGCEEIPYTKGGTKPKFNVDFNGLSLKEGKDYTVTYKNNSAVTTEATVKTPYAIITGKGNFRGTYTVPFVIVPADISTLKLSVANILQSSKAGYYASAPTVTDTNGKKLVKKTDYESTIIYKSKGVVLDKYSKPVAGDVIEVTVTGTKNYYGTITGQYKVYAKGKNLSTANVSIKSEVAKNLSYDGQPVTLTKNDLVVTINKVMLSADDYDIIESSYSNNTNKGKAKLTIVGKGAYAGSKVVTFTIKPQTMKWWQKLNLGL